MIFMSLPWKGAQSPLYWRMSNIRNFLSQFSFQPWEYSYFCKTSNFPLSLSRPIVPVRWVITLTSGVGGEILCWETMQKPMKQLRSKFHSSQSCVHNTQICSCPHFLDSKQTKGKTKQNKTLFSLAFKTKCGIFDRIRALGFLPLRIHLIPQCPYSLCSPFLKPNTLLSVTGPLYMPLVLLEMVFSSLS